MRVEIEHLSLDHADGSSALKDISLTVRTGEFCAILGSSGAGKTSLLRVLGGLAKPTSGRVWLDGRDCSAGILPDLRQRIGQVHQGLALVRQASSAANIVAGSAGAMPFWRALLGLYPAWAKDRAVMLHLAMGLEPGQLSRPVSALSGGQQQRVAIARALMGEPGLLLADEPVASLDPATADHVLAAIWKRQREAGMTVVCSLHQPELARTVADRIVVLDAGRIVFDGDAADYRGSRFPQVAA